VGNAVAGFIEIILGSHKGGLVIRAENDRTTETAATAPSWIFLSLAGLGILDATGLLSGDHAGQECDRGKDEVKFHKYMAVKVIITEWVI